MHAAILIPSHARVYKLATLRRANAPALARCARPEMLTKQATTATHDPRPAPKVRSCNAQWPPEGGRRKSETKEEEEEEDQG